MRACAGQTSPKNRVEFSSRAGDSDVVRPSFPMTLFAFLSNIRKKEKKKNKRKIRLDRSREQNRDCDGGDTVGGDDF